MLRKITKAMMRSRFDPTIQNKDASNSIRKSPRIKQKGSGGVRTALKKKKRSTALITAKFEVSEGKVLLELPIKTVSEANCFEPWQVKHGRHKQQQRIVASSLTPLNVNFRFPCRIMLTRFAPDELDVFDNLPMSFKYIVDAVCAIITGNYVAGKADSDKRISIACAQVESKAYGIRIEISF